MSERTIEATPQRRRQARLEGRFPRSRELTISALSLLVLAALYFRGRLWLEAAGNLLIAHIRGPQPLAVDVDHVQALTTEPLAAALTALFPLLAIGFVAMVGIQWTQGGFVWVPDRVSLDLSRVGAGWKRLLSVDRTIRSLFALLKMLIGLAIMLGGMWFFREPLVGGQGGTLLGGVMSIAMPVAGVALAVIVAVTILSLAEYAVRLSSYYRSLRMSADELRDEHRGRATMRVESSFPAGDNGPQLRGQFERPGNEKQAFE